jgi:hypothetical protein
MTFAFRLSNGDRENARPAAFIVHRHRGRHRECCTREDKAASAARNTNVFWNRWSASRNRRQSTEREKEGKGGGREREREREREEKRVPGSRASLSARCYWPRIDDTLWLRFNIFNELANTNERTVSKRVAPLRAEYLLLSLSVGNVDRITHHRSLNPPRLDSQATALWRCGAGSHRSNGIDG